MSHAALDVSLGSLRRSILLAALALAGCAETPDAGPPTSFIEPPPPPGCVATVDAVPPYEPRVLVPARTKGKAAAKTVNATTQWAYQDGAVYRVATAPGFMTAIYLQPGEKLNDKVIADADPASWMIGDSVVGTPLQPVVFLKPGRAGLRTNVVLTTSRRSYQLDATSYARPAMSAVRWTYPGEMVSRASAQPAQRASAPSASIDPTKLNFHYSIQVEQGDRPAWTPMFAFDDGAKTYVQFPPGLGIIKRVPLFVLDDGSPTLATFRALGNLYEVDGVFSVAELRLLNGETETVVRIQRTA